MEINNNFLEKVSKEPIDSFQLSYAGQAKKDRSVRLAADKELASNSQCVYNKMSVFKKTSKSHSKGKGQQIEGTNLSSFKNMLNIQLSYGINQAMVPDI